jgi:hypothetical protein
MPAISGTVNVSVADTAWMAVGQVVYIETAGYFLVDTIVSGLTVTLENLGYDGNAVPTTVISTGKKVSPGGLAGDAAPVEWGDILGTITDQADLVAYAIHQGTNTLTEPIAFIGDTVGIGTDDSLDAALTIFSDTNKGLKMRSDAIDRFHLYVDMTTEDVIFDTINAGLFFRRSGVDVMMFDDIDTVLYQAIYAGAAAIRGLRIDKGNQGSRSHFYVSDGSGGLVSDDAYADFNNAPWHIRTGSGFAKTFDFTSAGDFNVNNGDVYISDITKGVVLPDRSSGLYYRLFLNELSIGIEAV